MSLPLTWLEYLIRKIEEKLSFLGTLEIVKILKYWSCRLVGTVASGCCLLPPPQHAVDSGPLAIVQAHPWKCSTLPLSKLILVFWTALFQIWILSMKILRTKELRRMQSEVLIPACPRAAWHSGHGKLEGREREGGGGRWNRQWSLAASCADFSTVSLTLDQVWCYMSVISNTWRLSRRSEFEASLGAT